MTFGTLSASPTEKVTPSESATLSVSARSQTPSPTWSLLPTLTGASQTSSISLSTSESPTSTTSLSPTEDPSTTRSGSWPTLTLQPTLSVPSRTRPSTSMSTTPSNGASFSWTTSPSISTTLAGSSSKPSLSLTTSFTKEASTSTSSSGTASVSTSHNTPTTTKYVSPTQPTMTVTVGTLSTTASMPQSKSVVSWTPTMSESNVGTTSQTGPSTSLSPGSRTNSPTTTRLLSNTMFTPSGSWSQSPTMSATVSSTESMSHDDVTASVTDSLSSAVSRTASMSAVTATFNTSHTEGKTRASVASFSMTQSVSFSRPSPTKSKGSLTSTYASVTPQLSLSASPQNLSTSVTRTAPKTPTQRLTLTKSVSSSWPHLLGAVGGSSVSADTSTATHTAGLSSSFRKLIYSKSTHTISPTRPRMPRNDHRFTNTSTTTLGLRLRTSRKMPSTRTYQAPSHSYHPRHTATMSPSIIPVVTPPPEPKVVQAVGNLGAFGMSMINGLRFFGRETSDCQVVVANTSLPFVVLLVAAVLHVVLGRYTTLLRSRGVWDERGITCCSKSTEVIAADDGAEDVPAASAEGLGKVTAQQSAKKVSKSRKDRIRQQRGVVEETSIVSGDAASRKNIAMQRNRYGAIRSTDSRVSLFRSVIAAMPYISAVIPCHYECAILHVLYLLLHILVLQTWVVLGLWCLLRLRSAMDVHNGPDAAIIVVVAILAPVITSIILRPLFVYVTYVHTTNEVELLAAYSAVALAEQRRAEDSANARKSEASKAEAEAHALEAALDEEWSALIDANIGQDQNNGRISFAKEFESMSYPRAAPSASVSAELRGPQDGVDAVRAFVDEQQAHNNPLEASRRLPLPPPPPMSPSLLPLPQTPPPGSAGTTTMQSTGGDVVCLSDEDVTSSLQRVTTASPATPETAGIAPAAHHLDAHHNNGFHITFATLPTSRERAVALAATIPLAELKGPHLPEAFTTLEAGADDDDAAFDEDDGFPLPPPAAVNAPLLSQTKDLEADSPPQVNKKKHRDTQGHYFDSSDDDDNAEHVRAQECAAAALIGDTEDHAQLQRGNLSDPSEQIAARNDDMLVSDFADVVRSATSVDDEETEAVVPRSQAMEEHQQASHPIAVSALQLAILPTARTEAAIPTNDDVDDLVDHRSAGGSPVSSRFFRSRPASTNSLHVGNLQYHPNDGGDDVASRASPLPSMSSLLGGDVFSGGRGAVRESEGEFDVSSLWIAHGDVGYQRSNPDAPTSGREANNHQGVVGGSVSGLNMTQISLLVASHADGANGMPDHRGGPTEPAAPPVAIVDAQGDTMRHLFDDDDDDVFLDPSRNDYDTTRNAEEGFLFEDDGRASSVDSWDMPRQRRGGGLLGGARRKHTNPNQPVREKDDASLLIDGHGKVRERDGPPSAAGWSDYGGSDGFEFHEADYPVNDAHTTGVLATAATSTTDAPPQPPPARSSMSRAPVQHPASTATAAFAPDAMSSYIMKLLDHPSPPSVMSEHSTLVEGAAATPVLPAAAVSNRAKLRAMYEKHAPSIASASRRAATLQLQQQSPAVASYFTNDDDDERMDIAAAQELRKQQHRYEQAQQEQQQHARVSAEHHAEPFSTSQLQFAASLGGFTPPDLPPSPKRHGVAPSPGLVMDVAQEDDVHDPMESDANELLERLASSHMFLRQPSSASILLPRPQQPQQQLSPASPSIAWDDASSLEGSQVRHRPFAAAPEESNNGDGPYRRSKHDSGGDHVVVLGSIDRASSSRSLLRRSRSLVAWTPDRQERSAAPLLDGEGQLHDDAAGVDLVASFSSVVELSPLRDVASESPTRFNAAEVPLKASVATSAVDMDVAGDTSTKHVAQHDAHVADVSDEGGLPKASVGAQKDVPLLWPSTTGHDHSIPNDVYEDWAFVADTRVRVVAAHYIIKTIVTGVLVIVVWALYTTVSEPAASYSVLDEGNCGMVRTTALAALLLDVFVVQWVVHVVHQVCRQRFADLYVAEVIVVPTQPNPKRSAAYLAHSSSVEGASASRVSLEESNTKVRVIARVVDTELHPRTGEGRRLRLQEAGRLLEVIGSRTGSH